MKLLLIEDHQDIAGVIFDFFEIRQYQLDHANNGVHGLELASKEHYDLIILDLMLPKMDGLSVCKKLRDNGIDTPILMLTARDSHEDIIRGLEVGADDYLIKPFDLRILEARIKALLRRRSGTIATKQVCFGELQLNLESQMLKRGDCHFKLNRTLFIILKSLILNAPNTTSKEFLINEIWPDDPPEDDILRNHIYQLRSLIDKPFQHAYIKTIPKLGYHLIEDPNQ